jgi:hypothetical protein
MMPDTKEEFGEWRTAPDGMAHYVLAGKCLCGAKITEFGDRPSRKAGPVKGAVGKFVTPLCPECVSRNIGRWSGRTGRSTVGHEAAWWSWWHQRLRQRTTS